MDSKWGDTPPRDLRTSGQMGSGGQLPDRSKVTEDIVAFLPCASSGGMPTSSMHESRQWVCRVQMERQARVSPNSSNHASIHSPRSECYEYRRE